MFRIDLSDDICQASETTKKKNTMSSKKIIGLSFVALLLGITACGGGEAGSSTPPGATSTPGAAVAKVPSANMITAADITMGDIDPGMSDKGHATYDLKCQACHSTGPNRVVGPGWKGITERRKPEWIMNMMLNVDVMLESDPEAQAQLEECLIRMPNQGLSKTEGREVLEFMRTL